MRRPNITLLAVAVVILVLLKQSDAVTRLCANADNEITKLYIDGKDYTKSLPFRRDVKQCGCMEIPVNTGVIAIEAKNNKAAAAIQTCNTAEPVVYQGWVCKPADKVRISNWYKPEFNAKYWRPAKTYECGDDNHCRQYYKVPCKISKTDCFWSHKPAPAVRCRLEQCAEGCTGCKSAGPGSCDPGKCKMGSGTNAVTHKTSCNRRCRLEVKAWGKSGEAADGYIRVTDLLTNYVDEWTANVAGDYFATVDMSSCAVTNRNYFTWSQAAAEGTALYNTWNSPVTGANYINVIGIELGVGPSPGLPLGSYAPWIVVNTLGKGIAVPVLCNGKHHSYSAVLTGVQNGVLEVTNPSSTV